MFNFLKSKKEQQLELICSNILASEWLIKQYGNFVDDYSARFRPNLIVDHKKAVKALQEKLPKIVTLKDLHTNFLRPNTGLIRTLLTEYKEGIHSKASFDNNPIKWCDDDGKITKYVYEEVEILFDGKSFDLEENINHGKLIDSFNKSEIELIEAADLHLSIWEKGLHPYNFKTTLLCNQEFHSSLKSFFENELTKSEMDSMKFYNKNFRVLFKVQFPLKSFSIPNDSYQEGVDTSQYYKSFDEKFNGNPEYLDFLNQCKW